MSTKEITNTHRRSAIIIGALFPTAMVASLAGGIGFIEPIRSDSNYLIAISENETQVIIGVFLG